MSEDKLSKKLETYRDLAVKDKNIDVASLMISALQTQQATQLSDKEKRWGYLISFVLPPFGFLFALKFWFSGKDDGKQAAWICISLTAVPIIMFWAFAAALFSGTGASIDQIKQIKPTDIQQLYE